LGAGRIDQQQPQATFTDDPTCTMGFPRGRLFRGH